MHDEGKLRPQSGTGVLGQRPAAVAPCAQPTPARGSAEIVPLPAQLAAMTARCEKLEAELRAREQALAETESRLEEQLRLVTMQAAQLAHARDKALASTRAKAAFLAMISHEIRTPLNGILGMTESLLDAPLPPAQYEQARTVQRAGGALLALINDVLDFSKADAGRMELESIPFALRGEVENAFEVVAEDAERKGLDLALEIAPEVPGHVVGDPVRLRQLLLNLLGNAVKFTSAGEVVVTVQVERQNERETVLHFTVRDTGIGIESGRLAALFEPFVQGDAATARRFGGTGLGLAICKQLVELMGGGIGVVSEPGRGSTFSISLPFRRADQAVCDVPEMRFPGLSAVCIDRNATSRRTLCDQLARLGVAASAAGDAVAGAAELAGKGCDAVFVDHSTVERDPAAARALGRAIAQRGSKLILLAPLARRGSCELLLGTGIEQTLAKPVRRSHLVRALRGLPSAAPLVPAERPAAPARALRVLVVDDHPINQRVALGLLQKLGHGGEVASNGSEALVRLEHECFDLVLLDCQMPVMDGYEFARQLRLRETTGGALPLIAMTANALRGDREACIAAGMNDYLTKPLSLDALRRTLENWCDGAQRTSGPAP